MKIYLCTTVTSKDYKSWSNIPYLLHQNLLARGYRVSNFVFREIQPIKYIFNFPIRVLRKLFNFQSIYFYVRTPLHFFCTYLISQYIGMVSNSQDIMIVQGFSYPLRNNKNKMILIGDWPSSYLFNKFLKRKPGFFEAKSIEREDAVIESADAVVTLFPDVFKYLKEKYENKNIYYFGNVVNVDASVFVPKDILSIKKNSNRLLFVGQPFYIDGAKELISCVFNLRSLGYDLHVDVVGIPPGLIEEKYEWLNIHGYLDKGNEEEKQKYYKLLTNARLFVNTTARWNAFQATIEAMYFSIPIVVRLNDNLTEMFPGIHDFSFLVNHDQLLDDLIISSFKNEEKYLEMCKGSRAAVASHTWDNFIDNLVELIKNE